MMNKTTEEIEILKEGGRRLSVVLGKVRDAVAPGVTTSKLDALAERLIREGGDTPAFLGYQPDFSNVPFPGTLCTSVNDEIVHGIPSDRVLEEGDIVGIDVGLVHGGLFTDMAMTVPVGDVSEEDKELIAVTKSALRAGLGAIVDGNSVGDIGAAIESVVPKKFGIVRELGGHGVGHEIHEPPFIPHFGSAGTGEQLSTGMVLAIEPMINMGSHEVRFSSDGYTVSTKDGSKSAHFELTVAVTDKGADIITPPPYKLHKGG